jgi:nucleotide-binding universal stress UspA family protein
MYTRVLVPLDGSALAEQVLPYVRLLAGPLQAPVHLLRVIERPLPEIGAQLNPRLHQQRSKASERRQAQEYLEALAGPMREAGVGVATAVRVGTPALEIVNEAAKEPDTLVAMSTHGRSGIGRWLIGSVTNKVLRASANPVLVIRPRESGVPTEAKLEDIIVPLDGSALAEQGLPHVVHLSKALKLAVTLLRVPTQPLLYSSHDMQVPIGAYEQLRQEALEEAADYLRQVAQALRQQGVATFKERVVQGHPAAAIVDFPVHAPNCLFAMTTHGRSGVGRWLLGSVTDRVVQHSGQPVLVIRAAADGSSKE